MCEHTGRRLPSPPSTKPTHPLVRSSLAAKIPLNPTANRTCILMDLTLTGLTRGLQPYSISLGDTEVQRRERCRTSSFSSCPRRRRSRFRSSSSRRSSSILAFAALGPGSSEPCSMSTRCTAAEGEGVRNKKLCNGEARGPRPGLSLSAASGRHRAAGGEQPQAERGQSGRLVADTVQARCRATAAETTQQ